MNEHMAVRLATEINRRGLDARHLVARSPPENARLLARGELPFGRADLSEGQSAARGAAQARTYQAAFAGALGHDAGVELSLCPPQPADQGERSEHDVRHRSRSWRPGHGGEDLSRRLVHRALSGDRAQPERTASALSPVLLALRNSQPRIAGNARLDPRRRRTGLFAGPRLWRRLRQSRSDRRLRHRRRRGGNRRAGHQLALQQVSQSRARRRGSADPSSQRLQDRQSDGAGAHRPRGTDRR